jgi:hypothetical protein
LFVHWDFVGGPAVFEECEVSLNFDFNLWNTLELRIQADGTIAVFVNGESDVNPCMGIFSADTTADIAIGLNANATSSAWTVHFDNVVAMVKR